MAGEFSGKVVVVSGSSRGIGKAIAAAFAKEGAQTVLASSDPANLEPATKEVGKLGGPAPLAVPGDLRTLAGCEALFKQVNDKFKRCDVLVNNAGATRAGNFTDLGDDVWQDGFALKFFGAVRLTKLFWPLIKVQQGSVLFIGGGAARTPDTDFLIGASVNAGMSAFSKGLSRLGMREGVTVNVIHPGATATERSEQLLEQRSKASGKSVDELRKALLEKGGIKRMAEPDEIGALAVFLCSSKGRHIQGQAISVDGGQTPGNY